MWDVIPTFSINSKAFILLSLEDSICINANSTFCKTVKLSIIFSVLFLTSYNAFLNSFESSELTLDTAISREFSKFLPDSKVSVKISKKSKASRFNF